MSDTPKLQQDADSGLPSHDLLCSSIPSRLPDGRMNPAYQKYIYEKRKQEGRHKPRDAGYYKEWRDKKKENGEDPRYKGDFATHAEWLRAYRKTDAGKQAMKKWRMSEKGIAAQEKYKSSTKGQRKRHETGEEYASRIIRELEEISQHNANIHPR